MLLNFFCVVVQCITLINGEKSDKQAIDRSVSQSKVDGNFDQTLIIDKFLLCIVRVLHQQSTVSEAVFNSYEYNAKSEKE